MKMSFFDVLTLIGGLCLFLYGMNIMLCLESKRMNLFPNTSKIQHRTILKYCMGRVIHTVVPSHVEVCCLLERLRSAKDHIEISIDADDYYRIKDNK
jgi:hypothetical protein